jgi:hypothetical protein
MSEKYIVIKDILAKEHHWLGKDYPKGQIVTRFIGATYGCISPRGIAILEEDGVFIELPKDSLQLLKE